MELLYTEAEMTKFAEVADDFSIAILGDGSDRSWTAGNHYWKLFQQRCQCRSWGDEHSIFTWAPSQTASMHRELGPRQPSVSPPHCLSPETRKGFKAGLPAHTINIEKLFSVLRSGKFTWFADMGTKWVCIWQSRNICGINCRIL